MEQGLAAAIVQLPPDATLLMYEAEQAGVLRQAGIVASRDFGSRTSGLGACIAGSRA